jgi:GTP1/Obg family GTP-binding protein
MEYREHRERTKSMTGGEVAAYRASVSLITTTAQGIISVYRQNRQISKSQLQLLRTEAEKSVAMARAQALGDISRANLRELIDTARLIESLDPYSPALPYSMDQLDQLNRSLRRIVDGF